MYTPDEMELIHREVMRLRAGGEPAPIPEIKEPSPAEERRANLIALSILTGLMALALSLLFMFWEYREQMISMLRSATYVLFGILGIISLVLFVISKTSKDLGDRVIFRFMAFWSFNAFAFGLLLFVSINATFESVYADLEKQIAAEEIAK